MITRKELVQNHVLYNQSMIMSELIKKYIIEDDSIYEADVLEWWLVTSVFAQFLKEQGEVIVEACDCHWWGRQTSGQAIYIDDVIMKICEDL